MPDPTPSTIGKALYEALVIRESPGPLFDAPWDDLEDIQRGYYGMVAEAVACAVCPPGYRVVPAGVERGRLARLTRFVRAFDAHETAVENWQASPTWPPATAEELRAARDAISEEDLA